MIFNHLGETKLAVQLMQNKVFIGEHVEIQRVKPFLVSSCSGDFTHRITHQNFVLYCTFYVCSQNEKSPQTLSLQAFSIIWY